MGNNEKNLVGKTSTGHEMSNSEFIDVHFLASQECYERVIRAAGFETGWHVLDAGAGSGGFLPLLAELVGESGLIKAMDLAPENFAILETLAPKLGTTVHVKQGNVCELPYEDEQFDGIWNANVTQYLTDEELEKSLAEFMRVLKPGGLLAIKEIDMTADMTYPFSPFTMWRVKCGMKQDEEIGKQISLIYRVLEVPSFMRRAGFKEVTQRSFLQEWSQPLSEAARGLLAGYYQWLGSKAAVFELLAEDVEHIDKLNHPNSLLDDPNFYARELNGLFLGRKPE